MGAGNFDECYKTSKARVCVTVGMMTTGYDCPDILNLGLMRPIFSPSEFVQIKGRGTRKHDFSEEIRDTHWKSTLGNVHKEHYKLFDFFANCAYFEETFKYDDKLVLPKPSAGKEMGGYPPPTGGEYVYTGKDTVLTLNEETISNEGMRIDRELYRQKQAEAAFDAFIQDNPSAQDDHVPLKPFFEAYILDETVRDSIDTGKLGLLNNSAIFDIEAFKRVPKHWLSRVPAYIKAQFTSLLQ